MVAQRNGKLTVQKFHVQCQACTLYLILCFFVFVVLQCTLLQVSVGKEREAVSDMLPYLRLGYVSDPSEMQSVISSQGPICPVSSS